MFAVKLGGIYVEEWGWWLQMTHSVLLLYPSILEHLLSTYCMPTVLPALRGYSGVLGAYSLVMGVPTNSLSGQLPPPSTSLMSTSSAPSFPGLSMVPVYSFRLSRLSSWRVHAGLVSHSMVRPHQGTVVERIIPHPLYSAQNHDYDVALLRLRTPLMFSGEAPGEQVQAVVREEQA